MNVEPMTTADVKRLIGAALASDSVRVAATAHIPAHRAIAALRSTVDNATEHPAILENGVWVYRVYGAHATLFITIARMSIIVITGRATR